MGTQKRATSSNGKYAPPAPPQSEYPATEEEASGQSLSWTDADAGTLQEAIDAVTSRGDAISFARGRGGTWLSVTVLAGARRPKYTAFTPNQLDVILADLAALRQKAQGAPAGASSP